MMSAQHFLDKKVTVPNTTSAYSADETVGAPQELIFDPSLGTDLYLDRVDAVVQATAAPDLELFIFSMPLTTVQVDNTALAIDEAEFRKWFIGRVRLLAADFTAVVGSDILTISKTIPAIKVKGGHKYQMVVRTAAGVTFANASAIDIWFRQTQMKVED